MSLKKYRSKRNLKLTLEPQAKASIEHEGPLRFCIQKHAARRLHYDFRLENHGVLLSWAVPKGPSLDPQDKRLAVHVEDHPLDYQYFEGVIPKGHYGAGTVEIWDKGTFTMPSTIERAEIEKKLLEGVKKGHFAIELQGEKLNGEFIFQKLKKDAADNAWLLIKKDDQYAKAERANRVSLKKTKQIKNFLAKDLENDALTNLDKIYWPEEKYTKGDLLEYYEKISPYILPYLKNRPITLHRYPNGIEGVNFYQKELGRHPDWVKTFPVKHEGKIINYLLVDDLRSLLYAVNLGDIDFHPFISRISKLDQPDYCVIDLDPHGIAFDKVIEVALLFHEILEEANIPHYCKTSGGNGMHLYIPLNGKYDFSQSRQFAEIVAFLVNRKAPKITSMERDPKKRPKKIYLDCLQNRYGQTVVAPYSVRPRSGANVSMPLKWNDLNKKLEPGMFNIKTVPKLLEGQQDIFKGVLGKGINLRASLEKLKKMLQ